jgi:hypothetical protein
MPLTNFFHIRNEILVLGAYVGRIQTKIIIGKQAATSESSEIHSGVPHVQRADQWTGTNPRYASILHPSYK